MQEPITLPIPNPVAVVIVTWNSVEDIDACLVSAQLQDAAEIIVVDNGSEDGTVMRVKEAYPEVKVIPLGVNRGFAVGCNIGVANSSSPYILFLNDDARLQSGYVKSLLRALHRAPRAASAIGKLTYEHEGRRYIDSAGIHMAWHALRPEDRGHGALDLGQYDAPEEVFGPSGAAAFYRRAALDEVGPEYFDEDMFAYYEDVDLAWRLRKLGWTHIYEPTAEGHHSRRGPSEKTGPIASRAFINRYMVWLKNETALRFAAYAPMALPWEVARVLRRAIVVPSLFKDMPNLWDRARRAWAKRS